jgi:predicted lipoprotein with Yx(FWY)xxD motif
MTRAGRIAAAAALAAAAAAAGCGASPDPPRAATRLAAETGAPATGGRVTVVGSQFGPILADARGQALYFFSRERERTSRCYGACARAWPPVPVRGRPVAGHGAHAGLIGTTARRDGTRQVTYAGHPVYLYVGDSPGRVLCHGVTEFGGVWRVIRPNGTVVR